MILFTLRWFVLFGLRMALFVTTGTIYTNEAKKCHPIIKRKLQDRCRVFRDKTLAARKAFDRFGDVYVHHKIEIHIRLTLLG